MSLLAMTAAVTMAAANPAFDAVAQDDEAFGLKPPAIARRSPAQFPPPRFLPSYPGDGVDQEGLRPDLYPPDEYAPEEGPTDEFGYPEDYVSYPGSEEYWTYDGTGTIPLRYGVQTPDGSYEYDLRSDEITIRRRN
jgi:hypothetical protein